MVSKEFEEMVVSKMEIRMEDSEVMETSFDAVQNRIVFALVNWQINQERLKELPHFSFLDLAIVYYVSYQNGKNMYFRLITNQELEAWGVSQREVADAATVNTPVLLPPMAESMTGAMENMLSNADAVGEGDLFEKLKPDDDNENFLYILTNANGDLGAGCILYPQLLEKIADMWEDDVIILPSSVHEMLLIRASKSLKDIEELREIVQNVNQTAVLPDSPEEYLSDNVYLYRKKERRLEMVEEHGTGVAFAFEQNYES